VAVSEQDNTDFGLKMVGKEEAGGLKRLVGAAEFESKPIH
jgi:hypothetical protein